MSNLITLLASEAEYKQAFEKGLLRILGHRTAGTFILACANLLSHPEFLPKHQHELQSVFDFLRDHYHKLEQEGQPPKDAPDDVAVMKCLIDTGLAKLDPVQTISIKSAQFDFLLNYNPLRGFRPARMSKVTDLRLDTPFNPDGFHFNKPFLEKEIFAEGEVSGRQISLLYNKFPIMEYHALLVVGRRDNRNQYLSKDDLQFVAKLQSTIQAQNPHFVVAYNSLGAGASVNHLHFHCFLEHQPLPIFSPIYTHNGGQRPYPASCRVSSDPVETMSFVKNAHSRNVAYNLLFKDGKIFYLPRKIPTGAIQGFDIAGFGWSHLAGFFNVDSPQDLEKITVEQLVQAMQAVSAQQ